MRDVPCRILLRETPHTRRERRRHLFYPFSFRGFGFESNRARKSDTAVILRSGGKERWSRRF